MVEIRAAVRNAGVPSRVPLAGGTQALVHRLVTAALLLFAASAALSPAVAHQAPRRARGHIQRRPGYRIPAGHGSARPRRPPSAQAAAGGRRPGAAKAASTTGPPVRGPRGRPPARVRPPASPPIAHAPTRRETYVVSRPSGRFHESLWEIAQKHLGDGRRYREIFELNKDRVQPDGSRLTIASLIRPGWVLQMPRDAHGPGLEAVPAGESRPARPPPGLPGSRPALRRPARGDRPGSTGRGARGREHHGREHRGR